jgi:hypothetical protein
LNFAAEPAFGDPSELQVLAVRAYFCQNGLLAS